MWPDARPVLRHSASTSLSPRDRPSMLRAPCAVKRKHRTCPPSSRASGGPAYRSAGSHPAGGLRSRKTSTASPQSLPARGGVTEGTEEARRAVSSVISVPRLPAGKLATASRLCGLPAAAGEYRWQCRRRRPAPGPSSVSQCLRGVRSPPVHALAIGRARSTMAGDGGRRSGPLRGTGNL